MIGRVIGRLMALHHVPVGACWPFAGLYQTVTIGIAILPDTLVSGTAASPVQDCEVLCVKRAKMAASDRFDRGNSGRTLAEPRHLLHIPHVL